MKKFNHIKNLLIKWLNFEDSLRVGDIDTAEMLLVQIYQQTQRLNSEDEQELNRHFNQ